MPDRSSNPESDVDAFILHRIDSVPHLEALLLLWRDGTVSWPAEQVAKRLFVDTEVAAAILRDLKREGLISQPTEAEPSFRYNPGPERDRLIREVEMTYSREMIRISTMIHSKASSAVRQFARAFRFKKDEE